MTADGSGKVPGWPLNLYDVGAKLPEVHGRRGPGYKLSEIDNFDAIEWKRCSLHINLHGWFSY